MHNGMAGSKARRQDACLPLLAGRASPFSTPVAKGLDVGKRRATSSDAVTDGQDLDLCTLGTCHYGHENGQEEDCRLHVESLSSVEVRGLTKTDEPFF
jgi:hypothetical protein